MIVAACSVFSGETTQAGWTPCAIAACTLAVSAWTIPTNLDFNAGSQDAIVDFLSPLQGYVLLMSANLGRRAAPAALALGYYITLLWGLLPTTDHHPFPSMSIPRRYPRSSAFQANRAPFEHRT